LPITRACAAAGISRSSFHYASRKSDDVALVERIKEIREKKPRWGYKRVHAKLRKEGFVVNHKRVERIWRDNGFTLAARRRRKKVRTGETVPEAATSPNHVWTYDFMFDATHQGRRMKVLSIVDEFTREALAIVPARSLTSSAVKGVLARLFTGRGRPAVLRSACYKSFVNPLHELSGRWASNRVENAGWSMLRLPIVPHPDFLCPRERGWPGGSDELTSLDIAHDNGRPRPLSDGNRSPRETLMRPGQPLSPRAGR
jgi:transposase InsO family protein